MAGLIFFVLVSSSLMFFSRMASEYIFFFLMSSSVESLGAALLITKLVESAAALSVLGLSFSVFLKLNPRAGRSFSLSLCSYILNDYNCNSYYSSIPFLLKILDR